MTAVFADTFYFIALLSPADEAHAATVKFTQQFTGRLITTARVMTELALGLVERPARTRFVEFYDRLRVQGDVAIIPCTPELFDEVSSYFVSAPTKSGR